MKEMSYSRETHRVGEKKKKKYWEKAVYKYLMSIIKQKGKSQQNIEILTENTLTYCFSKNDLKDKNR